MADRPSHKKAPVGKKWADFLSFFFLIFILLFFSRWVTAEKPLLKNPLINESTNCRLVFEMSLSSFQYHYVYNSDEVMICVENRGVKRQCMRGPGKIRCMWKPVRHVFISPSLISGRGYTLINLSPLNLERQLEFRFHYFDPLWECIKSVKCWIEVPRKKEDVVQCLCFSCNAS